jgi:hypothetical protein
MFISSEIAIFKFFNDEILKHVSFFANLCLLIINEIHLICQNLDLRESEFHQRMTFFDATSFNASSRSILSSAFIDLDIQTVHESQRLSLILKDVRF